MWTTVKVRWKCGENCERTSFTVGVNYGESAVKPSLTVFHRLSTLLTVVSPSHRRLTVSPSLFVWKCGESAVKVRWDRHFTVSPSPHRLSPLSYCSHRLWPFFSLKINDQWSMFLILNQNMLIDSGIKIYACYSTQIYRRLDLHPTSHILLLKRYMGSILLILIFSHSSDNNRAL